APPAIAIGWTSMSVHLLNEDARGVFAIAVTPFSPTGAIDYASVDRLLEFYLEQRVHGLTILGMMGEAHKLSGDESLALTRHILRQIGARLPIVVGVSNSALEVMRGLARSAMDHGAAGVLVAPTAGLRTDDQLYGYYATVFETLGDDIPVAYQDYPQSTQTYLS